MLSRRDFYRYGCSILGGLMSLGFAVPGVADVLDPLWRKGGTGTTQELTRLGALTVGQPQAFSIIAERRDGWVKYPPEPVGTVWLIRQPEGDLKPVVAFTARCPHLGCSISLAGNGKSFLCPCHEATFQFDGARINEVSPRGMDELEVELTEETDPKVIVHYVRFRTQTKEKTPLSDIELVGERPQVDENPGDGSLRSGSTGALGGLLTWVEARTGLGGAIRATFDAPVPSVARFRYALGAALVSSLAVEVFTGFLLMLTYSPSTLTAWGSTFYIDRVLTGGWFLRGIHSFAGHAMIVAVFLHLASVVVAGVYRAPRELNWWLGLAMLGLVVGFILTGNALVWDQDGYWAWNIETSIAGGTPVVGPLIKRLVIGGTEMGNATLGRLYGLHVFLLPMLMILLLRGHVLLSRRHRLARPEGAMGVIEQGWPRQVYYDLLASAVLLASVTVLVLVRHGVSLDAPADPASQYPARPAWFFFWLFQLRKSFVGPREIIATMVIPGSIATVMLLLPLFDRVFPRRLAHFLACSFAFAVLGSVGYLTVRAVLDDDADEHYQTALRDSDRARDRAVSLALEGIPPEGASALLTRDPLHHGWAALQEKCLGCHVYDGKGSGKQTASDLKDFGSRGWLRGLLEAPKSSAYFGKARGCGGMARWKKNSKLTPQELDEIADFFSHYVMNTPADLSPAEWDALPGVKEHPGYVAFNKEGECITCHSDWTAPSEEAPSLFAWGTPQWITRIILKPGAPDLYGWLDAKHQMPSFAGQLTEDDVLAIVRFLKHDYLGAPVATKTNAATSTATATVARP